MPIIDISIQDISLENTMYYFDASIAQKYGVDEAILYQNIKFWCNKNKANNKHYHDGFYWTYNSAEAFSRLFPFWTIDKIRRLLKKMEESNMIKSGRYSADKTDRTYWYTPLLDSNSHVAKMQVGTCKNATCNNTDNKHTDISNTKVLLGTTDGLYPPNFIEYTNIIKNTAIKKGDFKTKVNKPTKTLLTVINYLEQIKKGTFKNLINEEWIKTQDINMSRIEGITNFEKLEKLLVCAFSRFKTMKTDSAYWPLDKKSLIKMSLSSFFYNPISGKSWFLKCLSSRPELLKQNLANAKVQQIVSALEKIDINIKKCIQKVYNESIVQKWNIEDQLSFYGTIHTIVKWREENKLLLKQKNEGWGTHFGSLFKTFSTIGNFLEISYPQPFPKFLQPGTSRWNAFVYWCSDYIGIDLNVTNKGECNENYT